LFHGVSVIIRSALYEGVLTGKYNAGHEFDKNDWRNNFFSGGHLAECAERVQSIYDTIPGIDCDNIAEYALKFALSHPAVTSVIVGMRSARHVYDNAKASSDFLLTPDLIKEMGVFDWQST
jgi:aryl-alcohol dehydrogenase-like predicted oxidoreductase